MRVAGACDKVHFLVFYQLENTYKQYALCTIVLMIRVSNVIQDSCWIVKQKFDIWLWQKWGQLKFNIPNELRTMDPRLFAHGLRSWLEPCLKVFRKFDEFSSKCVRLYCVQFISVEKETMIRILQNFRILPRIHFMRIHLRLSPFYLAHGPNGVHIKSFALLTLRSTAWTHP